MTTITGTNGNDGFGPGQLDGGPGDDQLFGLNGNDVLLSGGGNDLLDGGAGNDFMQGDAGDDTYIVDSFADSVIESSSTGGFDTVKSSTSFTLPANVEKLILTGTGNINGDGNAGVNNIIGNDGNNTLQGNGGDDFLDGGKGTDSVAEIADSNFSLSNNSLSFTGGVDELVSIERAELVGGSSGNLFNASAFSGSVEVSGGNGDDVLLGAKGGDELFGGNNSDVLAGGAGNDSLAGGVGFSTDDAQDKFVYNTGIAFKAADIGIDTISDFIHNSDKIVLDKKTFTSISSNAGTGFSQAGEFKVVTSDSAAKTSSADIVYNSANGKLFYNQNGTSSGFGSGAQFATLTGKPTLSATDFLLQSGSTLGLIKATPVTLGNSSNNVIQGQNIGGIVDGRSGDDTLFAQGGNDVVLGGNGRDSLDGGRGDDILFGGRDRDTLKGSKGRDTFVLASDTGVDVIKDYKDGIDKLGLANDVSFDQLQFVQQGSRTVIQSGGQALAAVNGMQVNQFTVTDFVSIGFSKFDGMSVPAIVG